MNGEDVVVAPLAKGANYYWRFPSEKRSPFFREDPVSHIGKSFTAENGKGFTWAQNPDSVHRRCEKNLNRKIIEVEDGSLLSGREFLQLMGEVSVSELFLVGSWFS